MVRTVAVVLALLAVQAVWLFPASGVVQWVTRHAVGSAEWIYSSYGTYFALWFCWLLLGWRVLSLPTDSGAADSLRRVLVAFPLLLVWDALFSQHPTYPVEPVNLLLSCWVSAAGVLWLTYRVSREITDRIALGVLALEALFALRLWNVESRIAGGFASPNLLYPLMLYGLLSSSARMLYSRQRYPLAWGVLAGVFATALGATGNRIGMVAAIVAICWMMWQLLRDACSQRESQPAPLRIVVLIALILPLAYGWYLRQEQAGVVTFSDRSVQGRPILWWAGLQVTWASHGLGCGVANYLNAQEQLNDLQVMVQGSGNMEPKNLFIAMAAIYGIPGVWYILSLLVKLWRFLQQQNNEKRLFGAIVMFSLLITGMADTPIFIPERPSSTFLWLQWMMISTVPTASVTTGSSAMHHTTLPYRILLAVLLPVLLLAGGLVGYTYLKAKSYRPQLQRLRLYSPPPLSAYPPMLVNLLVEREDKQFWNHLGADWRGIHRAMRSNIRTLRLAQGGSTITQQMVRNTLLERDFAKSKSFIRKGVEIWLSFWAERELGKQKILELYLQHAFQLAFPAKDAGMAAMAQDYFGKPLSRLTLDECAVLVGWLSAPPVNGVDWRRTAEVRNVVLSTRATDAFAYYALPLTVNVRCSEEQDKEE